MMKVYHHQDWMSIDLKLNFDVYNNRLEPMENKSDNSQPLIRGKGDARISGALENSFDYSRSGNFQRKISKRREAQQEKTIVLELFKQLVMKINEGYSRVIVAQNLKNSLSRVRKNNKPRPRPKQKDAAKKTEDESRWEKQKSIAQDTIVQTLSSQKASVFVKYDALMTYTLYQEQELVQSPL